MVSEDRINEIESRVDDLEEAVFGNNGNRNDGKEREVSMVEFIQGCNLPHQTDEVVAIGYYFEIFDDIKEYTSEYIKEGYRQARISIPSNVSDVLGRASKKAHLMEVGEDDNGLIKWALTQTGIEYVEEELKND